MKLKWNEVTWYSRLATIVVLMGAFPILSFYIGLEYANTLAETDMFLQQTATVVTK